MSPNLNWTDPGIRTANPDGTVSVRPSLCPTCAHRPHLAGECKARYHVTFEPGEPGDPCLCLTVTTAVRGTIA